MQSLLKLCTPLKLWHDIDLLALFIWSKVALETRGTPPAPSLGYDELSLSTDWNISVHMLCVAWLGPARRVDLLETVYMGKSWLAPQGHPVLPTEWPYPQGHPTPRARFAVSHVNSRRWFISNYRRTWLTPDGSGGRVPRVPGRTFLHINRALFQCQKNHEINQDAYCIQCMS